MRYHISNIIVVEGKDDEAYLSSFVDAVFVKTNGYEIPKEEIEFLNNKRIQKPIIVLTDSDEAGKAIRTRLNQVINEKINVEVNIIKCNKNNKHGVAECDKEEVIHTLKEYIDDKTLQGTLKTSDIYELEIDKDKRESLCRLLKLGKCNNKTFIKRLNYLGFAKDELKEYGNK